MPVTRIRGLALLLAGSALLPACASVPDLGARPQPRAAASFAATETLRNGDGAWPTVDWWGGYRDAQLDGLMREALAGAPTLEQAAARLRIAQGLAQQAGAALVPTVDLSGSAGFVQQSENNGVPAVFVPDGWRDTAKIGLGFSLDLDLWGRNRANLAAVRSDADAAQFELAEARLALTTGIASAYAEFGRLHAQHGVLAATLANREKTARLVAGRTAAGLDTHVALRQAQSRAATAQAELAATDEALALSRNALAALIGSGPDRGLEIAAPSVAELAPRALPANAAIDLVGRRPDVAAARASVEAEANRIKVARAAFYPNISLSGLIGLQSLGLASLLDGGSAFGNVGPAVSLPIFHGGALSGQYRGARGRYDEAVARYDGLVAEALRQVADALASRNYLTQRAEHSRQALAAAEQALALALQRYRSGLSTYLDVLSTEDGVLQGRRAVADLQARAFTLDVAMVRALGGGFATT
ncbi:efflux transporter outer membrane subunit [Novosphingobium sp. Gsoil 351]|uniref:efflux transporter outer membrane subunit n=1 Tax=Novosphingobium sp. Gsoil 351 TaxID=2675225 RepID=UPI0012B45409|nr:efflux transporter outer membrane subunit [Novosphingobium sp. Gsoil 351]QGN55735.1 efflux transporter outer membrane subunit [Novosphingobium sp. Gsoil 351]